jgi:hypothetical protein
METLKAREEMKDDSKCSLGELYGNSSLLVRSICQVERAAFMRDNSYPWARRIRLIDIHGMKHSTLWTHGALRTPTKRLSLTPKGAVSTKDYIAVSYSWESLHRHGEYRYVIDSSGKQHRAAVNAPVLDRTIRFAISRGLRYIWIDQECLDQLQGSEDMKTGIQSMDLVYKNSEWPVALLTVRMNSQDAMLLDQLLSERIFQDNTISGARFPGNAFGVYKNC